MHKQIAANTLYQTLTRGISASAGFVITILIAAKFGKSGYGDFTTITTFVAFFYLCIDLGLNAIFLQVDQQERYFKELFYLRFLLSFLLVLACNAIIVFLPYQSISHVGYSPLVKRGISIFSLTILTQGILLSANAIFQRKLRYDFSLKAMVLSTFLNLLLVGLCVAFSLPILWIIVAFVVSNVAASIAALSFTRQSLLPLRIEHSFNKKLIALSWPLGVMIIANVIYFRIDVLLLSLLKPSQDVGVYGLAYKFFDFLLAIPMFLTNSLYPVLLREQHNRQAFHQLIRKYFSIFLLLSVLFILPFWFITPFFALIKKEFVASVLPFRILLLSLPFFYSTSFLQWLLIVLQKQKYLLFVYLGSIGMTIVLNLLYIPFLSYVASAIITGASEGVVFLLLGYKVIRELFHE